ncbi:DUF2306 domain-containing protein [Chishuiella sp.]|uniref:DUF2306 domain-containing protein n=1 Tax=Chishuiella sp. TaxID=1969467 RepID=UPI0028A59FFB|nr:DUF2306 domain-containing protein [Chishuiella sp.]
MKFWKNILFLLWLYLFILMLEITLRYIPITSDASFLAIKQNEVINIPFYLSIFYVHVYSSIFVLFFGIFQFLKINNRFTLKIHKLFGKLYFYMVILFAAPSGIFIGFYANGEVNTKIAFIILGTLWLFFTVMGVIKVKNKNILLHRKYMLRSYALATSALTLRVWKVIIVYFFYLPPMDVYQIIAWLGFVPNLIFIELYITKKT